MAIIVLLANGLLQQMIQPIAYGAALGIHPLAVLIVTIAGGGLFGAIGLILARSAHLGVREDLRRPRAGACARAERTDAGRPDVPRGGSPPSDVPEGLSATEVGKGTAEHASPSTRPAVTAPSRSRRRSCSRSSR